MYRIAGTLAENGMASILDASRFSELAAALDKHLEETKEYVGTKQTEYEYKHRACLAEIHAIDDVINSVYGLTQEESNYSNANN